MATLERVMQMKAQGYSESQIMGSLMQEGVSPREITESISQSQIKSAALDLNQAPPENQNSFPNQATQRQPVLPSQISGYQMQPSIMDGELRQSQGPIVEYPSFKNPPPIQPAYQEQSYQQPAYDEPSYQETYQDPPKPTSKQGTQGQYEEYPEYQETYATENYPEYQVPQQTDIETINDLTEQIVDEKLDALKKQMASVTQIKEEIDAKIADLNTRMDRMEKKFDELQMSIIGRIGEYGQNIEDISKEMHMTQESFSKIIDPLTDNIRKLERITQGKD